MEYKKEIQNKIVEILNRWPSPYAGVYIDRDDFEKLAEIIINTIKLAEEKQIEKE